jgi:hypothetical protein
LYTTSHHARRFGNWRCWRLTPPAGSQWWGCADTLVIMHEDFGFSTAYWEDGLTGAAQPVLLDKGSVPLCTCHFPSKLSAQANSIIHETFHRIQPLMLSMNAMANAPSAARWTELKRTIYELYINQDVKLRGPRGLIEVMATEHNFRATLVITSGDRTVPLNSF